MSRQLARLAIIWTRPHSHASAAIDGTSRIWLDPELNQVERRCALTHELIHIHYGHRGCQSPSVERLVCFEAAGLIVRFEHLTQQMSWVHTTAELAEDLSVTEAVLIDRFKALDGDQLQQLWPIERHIA